MNSGFMMPWVVCITSILENNKTPIDFYIIYSHLEEREIKLLEDTIKKYGDQHSLNKVVVPNDTFSDLPIFGRSKEAYFRLLIPNVMPKNIDRCLYLDWDTVVYKSLESFYNIGFEEKAFVVNEDMGETIFYHKERHSVLKIPLEYKYFNSGVLLFNLEWFRNNFDMKTVFDWIKNNSDKLKFLDQDVLNANFYDKVKYTDGFLYDYLEILVSPF
jgi:lipopolysaccharide biosynthesis glycosyltransferase